jgi:hypothetical protein
MVNTDKKYAKNSIKTSQRQPSQRQHAVCSKQINYGSKTKSGKNRKNAMQSTTKTSGYKKALHSVSNGMHKIKHTVSKTGSTIFDKINNWQGLFPEFKSTNKIFAFILNSLAIGISAAIGILIHDKMSTSKIKFLKENTWIKYVVSGFGALCAAFLTYLFMLLLFGFGGGMLVNSM